MAKAVSLRYSVFDRWSPELAYLLGVTITDGCVLSAEYLARGYPMKLRAVEWNVKDRQLLCYRLTYDCSRAVDLLQRVYQNSEGLRLERKHAQWLGFLASGQTYRKAA